MKIALIGYGKMGQAIEKIALERGHQISARINGPEDDISQIKGSDVAIEFTAPAVAVQNIRSCFDLNIPVVVGTTGWYDKFEDLSRECEETGNALFTATNFSLGVNIFFELNKALSRMMNSFDDYKTVMDETHHTEKLDSPSGTAITLAEGILSNIDRLSQWKCVEDGNISGMDSFELPIRAHREENVPGTHEITYQSEIDSIEIKHTAHNRKGFALGAVLSAEFINGKKGVLGMKDMLKLY
jgi:4-hydroxy-tetrahydrodipicolinate reductase